MMNIPVPVPQTVTLTAHVFQQTIMQGIVQGLLQSQIAGIIDQKTGGAITGGQIADLAQYIEQIKRNA